MSPLAAKALALAATQVGVREHGCNRGPEIDGYMRDVRWPPEKADPWCAAFVCSMVKRAADALGISVPLHLSPGVFTLDERAPANMRRATPVAGSIFILNGHRHTGFVTGVRPDGNLDTIEGNTNPAGSSEGDGVYARTRRPTEIMGYLDLSAVHS